LLYLFYTKHKKTGKAKSFSVEKTKKMLEMTIEEEKQTCYNALK